jgi:integrase
MASIVIRGKSACVVYLADGKQKWETFKTEKEANARKIEIEYQQVKGIFVPPSTMLVQDFLAEYVEMYGITKWSHSTYSNHLALIDNYINPNIGNWKMKDITVKKMDKFFYALKCQRSVQQESRGKPGNISDRCIHDINLLLSNAFDKAVDWEEIGKNPVTKNACPDRVDNEREIWNPETAKKALALCDDLNLLACMHLAIACTMRNGEITGLMWQNISFGEIEHGFSDASLQIVAQLQRISRKSYEILARKKDNVRQVFPCKKTESNTLLVLKTLKTKSSKRVVWIPQTTAEVLWRLKMTQDKLKEELGDEYQDFGLVIAQNNGRPVEGGKLDERFKAFIASNGLPDVVFHSLRHLSTTVKLILSHGDVKAVQGDTGHKDSKMVTETYAHVLDENRKKNARLFEESFYGDDSASKENTKNSDAALTQLLAQCLENPETLAKLRGLFAAV